MKQLVIGRHPYTYARVSAMKTALIKKEEYQRMLKMTLNEVISFIQEGAYRKEVDELAVEHKGVDLLELALNKNLTNTINKLKRVSKENLRILIEAYLMRNDVNNIKAILRGKFVGSSADEIRYFFLPVGIISEKRLDAMLEAENVEQVVQLCGLLGKKEIDQVIKKYEESGLLVDIENVLDANYYARLTAFSQRLPNQGKLLREFLDKEMVITSIITALRLKRAGVPNDQIESYLLRTDRSAKLLKAVQHEGYDGFPSLFLTLRMTDDVKQGVEELKNENSLVRLETDLYRHLLIDSLSLLKRNPLSIDVILGYLFAKEIEIRNLKMILKAKQLDMGEEFMEEQLVA